MIINGGSRSNGRFFAQHLTNAEENERVTLCEIRNLAAQDVESALQEMEGVAMGTRCKNYFYHANINPIADEELTPKQWLHAVDRLEENLGLLGHARFVVEHHKKGRTHRHAVWLRVDVFKMLAVEMTDDYAKHQATARQLEREFALERGTSVLGAQKPKGLRPARRPKSWESFRGQQTGVSPHTMKEQVTALYRSSKDAGEFALALKAHGLQLARGDRAFCIVDTAGNVHSLGRRLQHVTAVELENLLGEIAPVEIPALSTLRPHAHHAPIIQ